MSETTEAKPSAGDHHTAPAPAALPYPLLLSASSTFVGRQSSSRSTWTVRIVITALDAPHARFTGRMDALVMSGSHIVTHFDGEIIDSVHYDFYSRHHSEVQIAADWQKWRKFPRFVDEILPIITDKHASLAIDGDGDEDDSEMDSRSLLLSPAQSRSLASLLSSSRYVWLRLKERAYYCGETAGLSIVGLYRLMLDRVTGELSGFYWSDKGSQPIVCVRVNNGSKHAAGLSLPYTVIV